MDWKLIAGLIGAAILLLINFWWFAIGQKKARLHRDWTPDFSNSNVLQVTWDPSKAPEIPEQLQLVSTEPLQIRPATIIRNTEFICCARVSRFK